MNARRRNTMTYRGYTASVEFDGEDGILVGRVLGIRDVIDCEGKSVGELEKDFRGAIDSYLAACRKTGKKPDKPCSGKLLLRLPPAIHAGLVHVAETTGQSANQLIVDAVRVTCLEPDASPPKPRGRAKRREVVEVE
jgi:predicted HicB family RNase H-like nuclease